MLSNSDCFVARVPGCESKFAVEATMSGNYSHFPFDPRRNYSSVLLQQGRILVDQDWNEQSAIVSRAFRAAVVDVLGQVFFATPSGFKIENDGRGELTIGRGRVYIDGLLAENYGAGAPLWDATLDEQHGAEPVSYRKQPYLPIAPALPHSGGPYLVYLDVWQREVTASEDPDLACLALSGVDTTTRLQTVWQVKLRKTSLANAKRPLHNDCDFMPAASRLSSAPGRYSGLENRLYRVEVHEGGKLGVATFKWSSDNASTTALVTRFIDLSHVEVRAPRGLDAAQRFSVGDLIEITDDACELTGLPGELRRIKAIDATSNAFTLDQPLRPGLFQADQDGVPDATRHMRVQRWHGTQVIQNSVDLINVEKGLVIRFDGDCFRTGDYWVIPARSDSQSFEPLDRAPPRGIHHHFAKLASLALPRRLRDLRVHKRRRR